MPDEIVVSTTSDSEAVAQEVASDEGDGRASVAEGSLSDFRETKSDDGKTTLTSYERGDSERARLLERLAQEEDAIAFPPEQETPDEAEARQEAIDAQRIRKIAEQDALEDARRAFRHQPQLTEEQPAASVPELEQQYAAAMQQARAGFDARMSELRVANPEGVAALDRQNDIQLQQPVLEALIALPRGADVAVFLAQNPAELQRLAAMPPHVAVAQVGQLAAQMNPVRRTASRAPAPIRPLSGSPTHGQTKSLYSNDLSYRDHCRLMAEHEKNRYGR